MATAITAKDKSAVKISVGKCNAFLTFWSVDAYFRILDIKLHLRLKYLEDNGLFGSAT